MPVRANRVSMHLYLEKTGGRRFDDAEMPQLWIKKRSHEEVSTLMARDRKIRSINCPGCGKPMEKHRKKAEYECINPRCPRGDGADVGER